MMKPRINMTYYSEKVLKHWIPTSAWLTGMKEQYPNEVIKVRFCRDCPYFISDYIPDEEVRYSGWCEWRSESEEGWHYEVMEDSFCNEDDIVDVY